MLNVKELMQELERENTERVEILTYNDINDYISDVINESVYNATIYYSDIDELFKESDDELKDRIISEYEFNNFNDYKLSVANEYLLDYYYSILHEMLIYATLDYMYNILEREYITEELYSDICYYVKNYEYSTLEEVLNDLELL